MTENACFEQGPIRPPSEARSLIIRPTRNCPWNKCAFCHSYKDTRFELRTVDEIKRDITAVRDMADGIVELSWKLGQGGRVSGEVLSALLNREFESSAEEQIGHVAAWLYFGGRTVFLQDGDTMIMKTDDLVEVLDFLMEKFPAVERITSYCRSKTACRKSVEDLVRIRKAGLNSVHVGLESGYDPLLKFVRKGETAADHIEGGLRIKAAGISLCEFVMPGLGGSRWSREHALETAKVINAINPDTIRPRQFLLRQGTDLYDRMRKGEFQPLGEDDVIRELRLFLEHLEGVESRVVSDHVLNLLLELEGKLPEERERLLGIIDRYLGLSDEDRVIFRLGARRGIYQRLDDLANRETYNKLREALGRQQWDDPDGLDGYLNRISQRFLP